MALLGYSVGACSARGAAKSPQAGQRIGDCIRGIKQSIEQKEARLAGKPTRSLQKAARDNPSNRTLQHKLAAANGQRPNDKQAAALLDEIAGLQQAASDLRAAGNGKSATARWMVGAGIPGLGSVVTGAGVRVNSKNTGDPLMQVFVMGSGSLGLGSATGRLSYVRGTGGMKGAYGNVGFGVPFGVKPSLTTDDPTCRASYQPGQGSKVVHQRLSESKIVTEGIARAQSHIPSMSKTPGRKPFSLKRTLKGAFRRDR